MLSAALRILATTALGGAAGFLGGLFGVGGGAIAIPLPGVTVPPRPADRPGNNLGHGRAECAARLLAIPAAGRDRSAHRWRPGLFGYGVYLPRRSPRHRTRSPWSASGLRSVSGDPRSDHCLSHPARVFAPARPGTARLGLVGATRDRWWHRIGAVRGWRSIDCAAGLDRLLRRPPSRRPGPWARPCRAGLGHRARGLSMMRSVASTAR